MNKYFIISGVGIFVMIGIIFYNYEIPNQDYPFDIEHNAALPELYGNSTYGQIFKAERNNLNRIDVLVGTFARTNDRELIFHLMDASMLHKDLRTVKIESSSIIDNKFLTIRFQEISDSSNKEYYFFIESPTSEAGNAITLWYYANDGYYNGQMIINNKNLLDCKTDIIRKQHQNYTQFLVKHGGISNECYLIHHFKTFEDWSKFDNISVELNSSSEVSSDMIIFTQTGYYGYKIKNNSNLLKVELTNPDTISDSPNLMEVTAFRVDPYEGTNIGTYEIGKISLINATHSITLDSDDFWTLITTNNEIKGNLAFRPYYKSDIETYYDIFLERVLVFKPWFFNETFILILLIIFIALVIGILKIESKTTYY